MTFRPPPILTVIFATITILAGCTMNDRPDKAQNSDSTRNAGRNEDAVQDPAARVGVPGGPAMRSPDQIRRQGNHLKGQASLYLQQHAHNPVDWYPWGQEALAKAKAEDKIIFLSIGYSSCHWCHVMEQEVFEQDDVADVLNRSFVCVKVDREERPDIDAVYMDAVHAITGRGGWPLSVFLTPALQPFFGGTYFPHEAFLELVGKIGAVYQENRDELNEQAARVARNAVVLPGLVGQVVGDDFSAAASLTAETIAEVAAQAVPLYDLKWGGFKAEQKFPVPVRWLFLLHYYRKSGDPQFMTMLQRTLEAMASGGIYDHVGGGFHRYSVDSSWIVPHFEKMLYDNAQLASLYLEAGAVLGRKDFLAVGKDVLDFLLDAMRLPEGGFTSSLDADSPDGEGSYYVWTRDEITIATNAGDGPALAALLGVDEAGNFEGGRTVLTRRGDAAAVAESFERDPEEVAGLFAKHRESLRAFRDRRPAPGLDRKIVTSWNGLAIGAMAQGYAVLGDRRYLEAAQEAADYLWRVHHRSDGSLLRVSNDGRVEHDAVLSDYAFLANGLLDLYQVSGDSEAFTRAIAILDYARERFAREGGAYYLTPDMVEAPLGRKVSFFDSVIPSGNAGLLQAMLRAGALSGNPDYRRDVQRALAAFAELLGKAGLEMSGWLDVALHINGPFYEVVIAGDPQLAATGELAATVLRTWPTHVVVAQVPAAGIAADMAGGLAPLAGKTAPAGKAVAYVCEYGACQAPTSDPQTLRRQFLQGWER
jgi:uncharacterized protein YyaL (SSP411 family)